MATMDDATFKQVAEQALSRTAVSASSRWRDRQVGLGDWFVVRALGKSDEHALAWLQRMNIEHYYPRILVLKRVPFRQLSASQRKSGVEIRRPKLEPMFLHYIFVRLQPGDDWMEIARFAGVGGMWCEGGEPVRIRAAELERVRKLEQDGAIPGQTTLRVVFGLGEHVRVTDGPFASFPGIVEEGLDVPVEKFDPDTRIKVAVNVFGRATPVELAVAQIEKAK